MANLGIFNTGAFDCAQLTETINVVPNNYGRMQELKVFRDEGVTTPHVVIELDNGVLNLLPPGKRGGAASVGSDGKRALVSFTIPCFPHEDYVTAEDVQSIRAFGSASELDAVWDRVIRKLETMKNKHNITLEYMRMGALQGKIKDDQGKVLLDLFSTFGVTEKVFTFNFSNASADVGTICRNIKRHMEQNLKGEIMSHVHCLCSATFFDSLITHPSVKEAYAAYQGLTPYREDQRKGFLFQGIIFEEYNGSASTATGQELPFVVSTEARFFPMGTQSTFINYFGPADFMETVNTMGIPVYAKQEMGDMGRHVKIHTQSNPLPLCLRPSLLVRGKS